ncbi:MAG: hypothetical protein ACK4IA_02050 [Paracoccus hibiscisoli]|uniref:hypothetical protein n=1 Tax=Paracoccus hibiscisoli TaxID=2023261 RepID=UPI003918B741
MYVLFYLVAAVATAVGAMFAASGMGYSMWQSVGVAFLALLGLQVLGLAYVVYAATSGSRFALRSRPKADGRDTRNHLSVMPK